MRTGKAGKGAAKVETPSRHAHGQSDSRTRPDLRRALKLEQERLGLHLLALRQSLELSQEDAAELAGVLEKYLSKLERGLANPTLSTLMAIAGAYKVSVASCFAHGH